MRLYISGPGQNIVRADRDPTADGRASHSAGETEAELPAALLGEIRGTVHHGHPGLPAARKHHWAKVLAPLAAADPYLPGRMAQSAIPTVRQLASLLLEARGPEALAALEALAEDDDWEVREWAADHGRFLPILTTWAQAGGRRARAVAVALVHLLGDPAVEPLAADTRLMPLLDLLVRDPDPYVQKSVGTFLLGDTLARIHPEMAVKLWTRTLAESPLPEAVQANFLAFLGASRVRKDAARYEPLAQTLRSRLGSGLRPRDRERLLRFLAASGGS